MGNGVNNVHNLLPNKQDRGKNKRKSYGQILRIAVFLSYLNVPGWSILQVLGLNNLITDSFITISHCKKVHFAIRDFNWYILFNGRMIITYYMNMLSRPRNLYQQITIAFQTYISYSSCSVRKYHQTIQLFSPNVCSVIALCHFQSQFRSFQR